MDESLIPLHGGYRKLKSFQLAQLVYDLTVRFCDRYINTRSRTHDQMVQAARSGTQNIAEGSQVSGTSKKMEMKLTSVARASLEELRRDYEDFLRQRRLAQWDRNDQRRASLIAARPQSADDVARWAKQLHERQRDVSVFPNGHNGQHGRAEEQACTPSEMMIDSADPRSSGSSSTSSNKSTRPEPVATASMPEIAANAALTLLTVACSLLDRQLAAQAQAFTTEGGFTERLYQTRKKFREGRKG